MKATASKPGTGGAEEDTDGMGEVNPARAAHTPSQAAEEGRDQHEEAEVAKRKNVSLYKTGHKTQHARCALSLSACLRPTSPGTRPTGSYYSTHIRRMHGLLVGGLVRG